MQENVKQDRLYVTVDLLIVTVQDNRLGLLLSKRSKAPYPGCWALPGKMTALDESLEQTASSLLSEILPVNNVYMEQLFTFSSISRDPRGRVISVAYLVIIPWGLLSPLLQEKVVSLQCFWLETGRPDRGLLLQGSQTLCEDHLAFDHGQIIRTGLKRMQGKLSYTELAFAFINDPAAFSLSELQDIFEAVLAEKMDSSNFRRSILGRYETNGLIRQIEGSKKGGRGRPAALYQFRS